MAKTTQKQFKYFKKCCEEFIELFGLKNWMVYYDLYNFEDKSIAEVHWKMPGNAVTVYLNSEDNFDSVPLTDEQLRRTALHEMIHLALVPLYDAATRRYVTEDEVERASEESTRIFTNVIINLKRKPA